jgi:SAM-dependent methyltransferase
MNGNELQRLYKIRFSEEEIPRKNEIWKVICKKFIQKYIKPSDTVVDVACGYGEFINNISAKRKIAIDINPDAQKLLNSDVEFKLSKATDLGSVIGNEADIIFVSNFLEHLADKNMLEEFLEQIRIGLKPGGKFLILGPNLRYLSGKYWDFYDHHLSLTHLSLCEILEVKGFEILTCIDKFLPYSTQGALPTHPFLVSIYLRIPLAWKILGKQFFVVARKIER